MSLINKTLARTDDQLIIHYIEKPQEELITMANRHYTVTLTLVSIILVFAMSLLLFTTYKIYKKQQPPLWVSSSFAATMLMFLVIILIPGLPTKDPNKLPRAAKFNIEYKTLVDIKDYVHINGDKLTIDALPANHRYVDTSIDANVPHTFRIDDYYIDKDVALIDKNNYVYHITQNQLKELKERN